MSNQVVNRKCLGFFPTPIVELKSLEKCFGGPKIFIKRDYMTGLAFGGNKTRKLEYFLGDAIEKNYDTIITGGAEQSNHCRQTAAAAAMCGLECHLVLGGTEPEITSGNLLLDKLLGAHIHWAGEFRKGEKIPTVVEELNSKGKKTYIIPYGGSNEIGALGFVEAVKEISDQLKSMNQKISQIYFASSSAGTHAGLLVGKYLYKQEFELIGIQIDKEENETLSLDQKIIDIANRTAKLLGIDINFKFPDVILKNEYLGGGYGIVGDLERRAISLAAKYEGILVDPVYTGRALGGMIDLIERNIISKKENVLFWHTGGSPAIFSSKYKLI